MPLGLWRQHSWSDANFGSARTWVWYLEPMWTWRMWWYAPKIPALGRWECPWGSQPAPSQRQVDHFSKDDTVCNWTHMWTCSYTHVHACVHKQREREKGGGEGVGQGEDEYPYIQATLVNHTFIDLRETKDWRKEKLTEGDIPEGPWRTS